MTVAQLFEDLTPGQRYYFATRAHNATGAGPWSDLAEAVAKAGIPDAPVLSLKAADGDSITLTWTVPEAIGDSISGYVLQEANAAGDGWAGENLLANAISLRTEFTHPDLDPDTMYQYRIRAMAGTVEGKWSAADGAVDDGFLRQDAW